MLGLGLGAFAWWAFPGGSNGADLDLLADLFLPPKAPKPTPADTLRKAPTPPAAHGSADSTRVAPPGSPASPDFDEEPMVRSPGRRRQPPSPARMQVDSLRAHGDSSGAAVLDSLVRADSTADAAARARNATLGDSLARASRGRLAPGSLRAQQDSMALAQDSLGLLQDSLGLVNDTLAVAPDSAGVKAGSGTVRAAPVEVAPPAPWLSGGITAPGSLEGVAPAIEIDTTVTLRPDSDAPDGILAQRAASELHLWEYAPSLAPTQDALLHRVLDRWDKRERLRQAGLLKPEVQAREDSLGFRYLEPTLPRLATAPPELVLMQISPQADSNSVEVGWYLRESPVTPRVRLTLNEYLQRLTAVKFHEVWRSELKSGIRATTGASGTKGGLVRLSVPFEMPSQLQGVFGKGEPNLLVRGNERITFSGQSRWRPNQVANEFSRGQSKFPQLDMKQELNLTLTGTIGDKVSVDVDQSSQTTTPLANRIKIRYKGYDDEVLQEVNLGNTSLSLPGTQYVTYSGKAEGLFGINALARLAAVDMNMILSKQEGRSETQTLSRSAEVTETTLDDLDWERGRYFFFRDPDGCPWELLQDSLEVYIDDRDPRNDATDGAVFGFATVDGHEVHIPPGGTPGPEIHEGKFHLLRRGLDGDYDVQLNLYPGQHVLILNRALSSDDALAVHYAGHLRDDPTQVFSEGQVPRFGQTDTLYLKMLRPSERNLPQDLTTGPWAPIRNLELKNIYNLGARNILSDGFELRVHLKETNGTNSNPDRIGDVTFIEMTGLDLSKRESGNQEVAGTDDRVDQDLIQYNSGLLIFPDLRPFDPDSLDLCFEQADCPGGPYCRYPTGGSRFKARTGANTLPPEARYRAPNVYDRLSHPNPQEDSKYEIRIRYKSPVTNIQLNQINIIPGSEAVKASGRTLVRDRDYRIDYDLGEIEILDEAGVTETDRIDVTYAHVPFGGGGAQKTLVGASASYRQPESKLAWSSAWMFEGRGGAPGLQGRRPRLGEEPARTLVGEFASSYKTDTWLLTNLANALPGVNVRGASSLSVDAGVGLSLPNPNTRDKLYIDDFDGAKDVLSLSMSRRAWRFPSVPLRLEGDNVARTLAKSELFWYTPRAAVQEGDLQPTLDDREADDYRTVLELKIQPTGETETQRKRSWFGVTQRLSDRGVDLSRSQFIDLWINDSHPYNDPVQRGLRTGKLYLDLGTVSEDAIWLRPNPDSLRAPDDERLAYARRAAPNGRLDTEDTNADGRLDQSSSLDEDTGLDGIPKGAAGDDPRDDYFFDEDATNRTNRKYAQVNGTENNQELDTEDLDGVGNFDRLNSYFEIAIDLADSSLWLTDVQRDYGGLPVNFHIDPRNGWRRIRISLANDSLLSRWSDSGVAPSWDKIFHARLWGTGFADTLTLQLGSLDVIGNRWFEGPLSDARDRALPDSALVPGEDFFPSVLNNKDDAAIYDPPIGLRRQNDITEREQSITLELANFPPGHRGSIFRTYPKPQDYTLYQNMEFYVKHRLENPADLTCAIRLCKDPSTDTLNYYEYRAPVSSDWRLQQIDFAELSQLQRQSPDSSTGLITRELPGGVVITRRGAPSLTAVQRISFSVTNTGKSQLSRGNVWIDELRLTEVRKDRGVATRLSVGGTFADFGDFNFGITRRNADFLQIGAEKGSGVTTTAWSAVSGFKLEKFVESWRIRAPFRMNFQSNRSVPKFGTNTDLFVQKATDRDIRESGSREFALNLQKETSENPWVRYGLAPFNLSGNLTRRVTREPLTRDTTETRTGGVGWNLPFDRIGAIGLGKDKSFQVRYLPTQLSLNVNGGRTRQRSFTRSDLSLPYVRSPRPNQNNANLSFGASARPITLVNYDFDTNRNLLLNRNENGFAGVPIGREVSRKHTLSANYDLPIFRRAIAPKVSWNGGSSLTFLQQGQTEDNEPDRFNAYSNNRSTTYSAHLALAELSKALREVGRKKGDDKEKAASGGGGGSGGLRGVSLAPINFTMSRSTSTNHSRRKGEPSLLYQLGIADDVGDGVRAISRAERSTTSLRSLNLDSRMTLPAGMSVTGRYGKQQTESQGTAVRTFNNTTRWPELDFAWGNLHKSLLKRFGLESRVKTLQATTRYSRETTESGTGRGRPDQQSVRTSWAPLLSLNTSFSNGLSATLLTNYRSSQSDRFKPSHSATVDSDRDFSLSLKKKLDLVKKVKVPGQSSPKIVNTNMDLTGTIELKSRKTVATVEGSPPNVQSNTSNFKVTLGANYRFTESINGTGSLNFGQDTDKKNEAQTSRFIGLSVSASFSF